jgi:hypothetical protein
LSSGHVSISEKVSAAQRLRASFRFRCRIDRSRVSVTSLSA